MVGAARYERSADRQDYRSGSYTRKLQTKAGEVGNVSVLIAIGVGTDGHRRVLGVVEGAKEDKAGLERIFASSQVPGA